MRRFLIITLMFIGALSVNVFASALASTPEAVPIPVDSGAEESETDIFEPIRDFIFEVLESIFTVEDDYFTKKIEHYKTVILGKSPAGDAFNRLMEAEEKEILDIEGNYSSSVINLSGLKFVDFSYFHKHKENFQPWVDGFFMILFFFYNLNQFIFLIRGTHLFRAGKGGDSNAD